MKLDKGKDMKLRYVLLVALALVLSHGSVGLAQTPITTTATPTIIANPGTVAIAPVRPVYYQKVVLSASSANNSYYSGEPIVIDLTLQNRGTGTVALSRMIDGNIVVTGVTHNGSSVPTHKSTIDFGDGFNASLSATLELVAGGSSLSSQWRSSPHGELGGEALTTSSLLDTDDGAAVSYSFAQPGTYSVTFHYSYPGTNGTFGSQVFRGKTNSVTVSFSVM